MNVEIKCKGSDLIDIDALTPMQGDLKTLSEENYNKLKKQILSLGFSEPISVWKSDKNFVLNGHQRLATLRKMRDEGVTIPLIPIVAVEAANVLEAKKKILSLTSQFGEITLDGLSNFMIGADFNLDDIKDFRFPEIDFDKFENLKFDEIKEKEFDENIETKNECPSCKYKW